MTKKDPYIIITLLLFCTVLFSQNNKIIFEKYKVVDRKEFFELQKTNPKTTNRTVFEDGSPCTKKEFDSLFVNSQILNYKQVYLVDTLDNEFITLYKKLTKEEIKSKEQERKNKLKADKEARNELDGTIVEELNLEDINGVKFNLENLKGKVIVLNFWFTRCKPCIAEFKDLNNLKEKYKNQEVEFFAITFDDKEEIEKLLVNHKLDFTIIPNSRTIINKFKIPYYPCNIIIDKNRKMEYINGALPFVTIRKMDNKLSNLLSE